MTVVHIIPVGTSILSNANPSRLEHMLPNSMKNLLKTIRKYGVWEWGRAKPGSPSDEEAKKHAYIGSPVFKVLKELVAWNPRLMSAELNSLLAFIEYHPPLKPSQIYLYHTDTGTGKLCAEIVLSYLKDEDYQAEIIRVKNLGLNFEQGLIELLNQVGRLIHSKKKQGCRVYLNATAGYKAENAFIALAGWLLKADGIYYMHEAFNAPVMLPSIPVTIEQSALNVAKELRQLGPAPKHILSRRCSEHFIKDLEYKGILHEKEGLVYLKDWVKALLDLLN